MEESTNNNVIEDSEGNIINKQNFFDLLATTRNVSYVSEIWDNWNKNISSVDEEFRDILLLVKKAASSNGKFIQ